MFSSVTRGLLPFARQYGMVSTARATTTHRCMTTALWTRHRDSPTPFAAPKTVSLLDQEEVLVFSGGSLNVMNTGNMEWEAQKVTSSKLLPGSVLPSTIFPHKVGDSVYMLGKNIRQTFVSMRLDNFSAEVNRKLVSPLQTYTTAEVCNPESGTKMMGVGETYMDDVKDSSASVFQLTEGATEWKRLETTGDPPHERKELVAVGNDRQLFVFCVSKESTGLDTHVLDLDTMEWSKPETSGSQPTPRRNFTATWLGDQRLMIYGGQGNSGPIDELDQSLFLLNTETFEWETPKEEVVEGDEKIPEHRHGHSTTLLGSDPTRVLVLGGRADISEFGHHVWTMQLKK
eukprot:TRINITY_DN2547_c0_g1_i1.p1 TRINITY_DN2547_c0_g1~~TRINITY_DN2547_c0_g1_i1.p1  ORF type:complete len:344 (-),score=39.58 TRINITY_DN2547_c0_g1_i1:66-1097(-)